MAAEPRTARLEAVVDHGFETRTLVVRPDVPFAFRPGQFLSCLLPVGGETLIRPYSIASDPESADRIELLLNRVPDGPGTAYLFGLAPGATLRFTGPWGTFVLERAPAGESVFVADGTGIAPIRPMLHRALATGAARATLLAAAPSPAQLLYRDEWERLRRARPAFAFAETSSAALADEVARRWIAADDDRTRHFFICGVGAIVPALRDTLRRAGYERRAVQYEKW